MNIALTNKKQGYACTKYKNIELDIKVIYLKAVYLDEFDKAI